MTIITGGVIHQNMCGPAGLGQFFEGCSQCRNIAQVTLLEMHSIAQFGGQGRTALGINIDKTNAAALRRKSLDDFRANPRCTARNKDGFIL